MPRSDTFDHALASFKKHRTATEDFILARAREHGKDRFTVGFDPELAACAIGVRHHRNHARKRMTDISRRHVFALVDFLFKRKHQKHVINRCTNLMNSLGTPGPD